MAITTVTLFLSWLAVSLAIIALGVNYRGSAAHLSKQFSLLQQSHAEQASSLAILNQKLTNLKAQVGMAQLRSKRAEVSDEPTTDEDKARVRRELGAQLARGEISPLRP